MASKEDVRVIGIDPGSGKGLCSFDGNAYINTTAVNSRLWVEAQLAVPRRILLTWDAPISFDCAYSLSTRPVERSQSPVAIWVGEQVQAGRIAKKAVSIGGFSGLSHWVISCHCLGMPYGVSPDGLRIASHRNDVISSDESMSWVIEVHPAVSMAIWWVEKNIEGAFPKYKRNKGNEENTGAELDHLAQERIWEAFVDAGLADDDPPGPTNDDQLDAWVAWKMGVDFLSGKACWVGTPHSGGFVLPIAADEMFGLVAATNNFIQQA